MDIRINVGFFTKGNYEIGFGHIVRCINLAKILSKNTYFGEMIFFSLYNKDIYRYIQENNFHLKILPSQESKKIEFIINKINKNKINLLIIDIPEVQPYLIEKIKNSGNNKIITLVLDTSNKDFLNIADLIVNILQRFSPPPKKTDKIYQGIEYWILDPNLTNKKINFNISNEPKTILITFGTTDPKNLTKLVCDRLKDGFKDYNFIVIIGPGFEKIQWIRTFCKRQKNFKSFTNPSNFYNIMQNVDIALSAGGNTLFELLYIGVPTIIIPNSKDNLQLGRNLKEEHMVLLLDGFPEFNIDGLLEKLKSLTENYDLREILNKNTELKLRENGAKKIERILLNYLEHHPEKLITKNN